MWHRGKWREVSPTFDQFGGMKKGEKGEKPKRKSWRKIGQMRERKKEKKRKRKFPPHSDGSRIKVGPRNESNACVPKSGSFIKLQEVENFSTRAISSLKAI